MKKLLKTCLLTSLFVGGITTFLYEDQVPGPPSGAPDKDTDVVKTL